MKAVYINKSLVTHCLVSITDTYGAPSETFFFSLVVQSQGHHHLKQCFYSRSGLRAKDMLLYKAMFPSMEENNTFALSIYFCFLYSSIVLLSCTHKVAEFGMEDVTDSCIQ